MTENQSPVYVPTIDDEGVGHVPMINADSGATLPFNVVLSPEKTTEWVLASDEERRASMATVAVNLAMMVGPLSALVLSQVPFPVQNEEDIAAAYNFLLTDADENGPDHRLEWVDRETNPGTPQFTPAELS